jgi:ribonuclease-3
MGEPKTKRVLDGLDPHTSTAPEDGVATKKQRRPCHDEAGLLAVLENGLSYVQHAPGYGAEAKTLAAQLQKLLFPSTNGSTPSAQEQPAKSEASKKIDHTDVPPPFPFNLPQTPMFAASSAQYSPTLGLGGPIPSSLPVAPGCLPALPPITDLALMSAPFTHASTLPHYMPPTGTNTYEPLEFLGDAYLEVIATRLIHDRFPLHTVGQKAGLREMLIRNDTLSVYSKDYGFDKRIMEKGLDKEHGGKAWIKVLADVFEAYVACVILSDEVRGMQAAASWLSSLWEPKIREWREQGLGKHTAEQEQHASTDLKSTLQKIVVSKGVKLEYVEERPMEHVKDGNKTTFWMGVYLTGWGYNKVRLGGGSGRSKQIAGAEAARDAFVSGKHLVDDAHAKKLDYDRRKLEQDRLKAAMAPPYGDRRMLEQGRIRTVMAPSNNDYKKRQGNVKATLATPRFF